MSGSRGPIQRTLRVVPPSRSHAALTTNMSFVRDAAPHDPLIHYVSESPNILYGI